MSVLNNYLKESQHDDGVQVSVDPGRAMVALARVDQDLLAAAVKQISDRYPVRPTSTPLAGLAMMRVTESVNGDAFNLGEIPLSSATIDLELPDGSSVSGGACIMVDDPELVTNLAICDAVLRHTVPGGEAILGLLALGRELLQQEQDIRQSILDRSQVRFSLLNEDQNG